MDAGSLGALAGIVAIVATMGMPVAIVFVVKYFRMKERELALENEARQWAEKQHLALESRVQRLENVLLSLDADLRTRGAPEPELLEGPASAVQETLSPAAPLRNKLR